MIRITIEVDELEELPGPDDEAQRTALADTFGLVLEQVLGGETAGYVEDVDGAPNTGYRVDEGLPGGTVIGTRDPKCRCSAPRSHPIHTSGYVTGLSGHVFAPES